MSKKDPSACVESNDKYIAFQRTSPTCLFAFFVEVIYNSFIPDAYFEFLLNICHFQPMFLPSKKLDLPFSFEPCRANGIFFHLKNHLGKRWVTPFVK